jgi:muramoyltetrapeptide carboxypeptidase
MRRVSLTSTTLSATPRFGQSSPRAGGKGAYRISHLLDFEAARSNPKPLIGFSDITILHMALWRHCRLVGMYGHAGALGTRNALMSDEPVLVLQDPAEPTAAVTVPGRATGYLMGGNLGTLRTSLGRELPRLDGAILLIEDTKGTGLGQVDRELTQLMKSGYLDGLHGIAVGQFTGFDNQPDDSDDGWTVLHVLKDRLAQFGVPVLGGLPIGHGAAPRTVPLGTSATIDTETGTLTVQPGVR